MPVGGTQACEPTAGVMTCHWAYRGAVSSASFESGRLAHDYGAENMRIMTTLCAVVALTCSLAVMGTSSAMAFNGEIVNKEGKALVKNHFTIESTAVLVETTSGFAMTCKSSTGTGVVRSTTEGESTARLSGCESSGKSCSSGSESGVVNLALRWELVHSIPDNLLRDHLVNAVTITCGTLKEVLTGGWDVPIEPMDKLQKTYTLTAKETKGKQEPFEEFEHTLKFGESGKEAPAGIKETVKITYEEEVEAR